MSELSEYNCPRCKSGLYIETSTQVDGVDLLICKGCWGVAVAAKSMELVISNGNELDKMNDESYLGSGCDCPICSTEMKEIELDIPEDVGKKLSLIDASPPKKVIIDSCENCPTFWFDAGELDLLNGIKPKARTYDSESNRLIDDQTLTEEDIKRKMTIRRLSGLGVLVFSVMMMADGGIIMTALGAILGLGGIIAMLSSDPEKSLNKGTCDKCLTKNKFLAWNCQNGGCWAHICTDCQTIGSDPVETYAKTLGKVAVGTVVVGVGVIALVAIAEGGGAGLIDLGGGIGGSLTNEKKEKNPLLLCNKCFQGNQDIKEKKIIAKKKKTKLEAQKKDISSLEKDIEKTVQLEEEILSDGYCSHIDILNGKKCGRIEFRKTGLCYVHK